MAPDPSSLSGAHRQRRKDARPQELLDAALELFVEKGFAATRSEEVAARAGVSKGTLYLYYESKEELLKAVIRDRLSEEIRAGADEAARHDGPCGPLLRNLLARWWLHVLDSPASGVFKLVITEARTFPDIAEFYRVEVIERGHAAVGAIVQRGIDRGEFHPVDVIGVVQSLLLPMVMLCLHRHALGPCAAVEPMMAPADFVHQHLDLVLRGLERQPAPQPAALSNALPSGTAK